MVSSENLVPKVIVSPLEVRTSSLPLLLIYSAIPRVASGSLIGVAVSSRFHM